MLYIINRNDDDREINHHGRPVEVAEQDDSSSPDKVSSIHAFKISYDLWKSRSIMPVKASGDKHFSYGKSSENFATLLIMRMVLIEKVSKIVRMDQGIGWLLALRSFLQQCP